MSIRSAHSSIRGRLLWRTVLERIHHAGLEAKMDVLLIMGIIRSSWSSDTTDDWHPDDPPRHHCGVTALVIQDFFGGQIVRNNINDRTVYFNILPSGACVFNSDEYTGRRRKYHTDQTQSRDQMMAHADMPRRYKLLSARVRVAVVTQGEPTDLIDRDQVTRLWVEIAFEAPELNAIERDALLRELQTWAQVPFEGETPENRAG